MTTAAVREHRIEKEDLAALLKLQVRGNPKSHATDRIKDSVDENGFVMPVLVDDAGGLLGAGHGRLADLDRRKKAKDPAPLGIEVRGDRWFVPVIRGVRFKSKRAFQKYLLADNQTTVAGGWDDEALGKMLRSLGDDLVGTGFSADDADKLLANLASAGAGNTDPDAVPDPPKKAVAKTGDMWHLGDHRLLCGDSTIVADVERLMGTNRAKLMATDPPYGVDYTDAIRVGADRAHVRPLREQKWKVPIDNDDKVGANIQPFLEAAFKLAVDHALVKNAAWYLWHAQMTQGFFAAAAAAANLVLHRQIIWVKPALLFGFGMYHWRHELAFVGWQKGHKPPFFGPRNQTTVWEVTNETTPAKRGHPTQKPVKLFEIPMSNHTAPGQFCYEPFSGSGTQVIAGEMLGRRVMAIEKDPRYVDVAVERFQNFSGKKAKRTRA